MNKKYAYAFAALMLGLTACSNEDLTSPTESPVAGKTVHVTLIVNRPSDVTRTVVDENDNHLSLYSHWVSGDKLLVVNSANENVGELTIDDDSIRESVGVFSGNATISTTEKYTLIYLGGKNGEADPYASWNNGTGVSNSVTETGFTLSGAKDDLCRADLMKKEGVQFIVSNDNAYPAENVTLDAVNAMAHFTLTNLPSVASDATLTVNYGDDITHTISGIAEELYLPMPTGTFVISFNLSNGEDSYTASIKEGSAVTVNSGLYYAADDNGTGKGIEAPFVKVNPVGDDEVVGPAFQITDRNGNNVWVKFTRANLHYRVNDGTWYIPENQTDWVRAYGTGEGNLTNSPVLDLFRWGATGYKDANKNVRTPLDATNSDGSYPYVTESNSYLNLLSNDHKYAEWGWIYSYQKNGKKLQGIKDEYFTLSSEQWRDVFTKFVCLASQVTDKDGVIILPYTTEDDAKKALEAQGIETEYFRRLDPTASISQTQTKWTNTIIEDYSVIESLNAVFLPAVGYQIPGGSIIKGRVAYWSSTGLQTNANRLYVRLLDGEDNSTSANFEFIGAGKRTASSVRLVKVVDGPDNETVGK